MKIFKGFEKFSALKINVDKYKACWWIGKAKYRTEYPVDCTWRSLVSDPIKILGAYLHYDDNLVRKKNFQDMLEQIRTIPNIWKQRCLTLTGRITIFKTFMMSKALYISSNKKVPCNLLSELEKIYKDFISEIKGQRSNIQHSWPTMIGGGGGGGGGILILNLKLNPLRYEDMVR